MAVRTTNRTTEILEARERARYRRTFLSYEIESLARKWEQSKNDANRTPDFFIIRCVTILEVFTRRNVAELIDHARPYMERAGEIARSLKIDFSIAGDIQGKVVTLGDLVAHSISVNSFEQVIWCVETLLDKSLRPLLESAADRWRTEVKKEAREPIIKSYDQTVRAVARLFELRHILCHEMPSRPVYADSEIGELLVEANRFARALEEVLTFEKFGKLPLTQSEMNIHAAKKLHASERELDGVLQNILKAIKRSGIETARHETKSWEQAFEESQNAWKSFRDAHCDFVTYINSGGTIRPLLWANEANRQTKARIDDLKSWIEVERTTLFDGLDDQGSPES